jgi:hypothetical protein
MPGISENQGCSFLYFMTVLLYDMTVSQEIAARIRPVISFLFFPVLFILFRILLEE